jgi:sugar lactone lactonase YvrE
MGVTTALGVLFDRKGRLYVLESITSAGFPGPGAVGTGTIVRFDKWGVETTIATGLTFPTAMTFGPDGNLYVSNFGFGIPGSGQIVKVKLPHYE